jgi:hypothetical protein
MTALYLVKWLDTIEVEKEAGLVDEEEQEILARLQELLSQTDFMANEENLSAVVLELGAGLLSEACVYGCILLYPAYLTNSPSICRTRISSTCKTIEETVMNILLKVTFSC